ncbi:MAG: hypothetical protein CL677_03165 [Bdellovibrionaceae bacterium]|nr:hypothetical protein [Pseudobdellovibrionaceae bacterium]|tara:strand:- start:257094 stop:258035 length:942 start_codon:yes stop_codon:yes gene_type:complete
MTDTSNEVVLAYDLGGTKMIAAAIDGRGNILDLQKELVKKDQGMNVVLDQLIQLAQPILQKYPQIQKVAMASAGPLDPGRGELLDPTNLVTVGKSWGVVPIAQILSDGLKLPVQLENDAAAAVLSNHWVGEGKGTDNLLMLTLGTGLGVGVIANGQLVRAGRHLHPEGGHIILNCSDKTALCGCGNYGCAEAYLSGVGFCTRYAKSIGEDYVKGQEVMRRAEAGETAALNAFTEYSEMMAQAIASFVVLFAPEKVVFAGGFSASHHYWLKATEVRLEQLLARRRSGHDLVPQLEVAQLNEHMVVLGAARIAMQ